MKKYDQIIIVCLLVFTMAFFVGCSSEKEIGASNRNNLNIESPQKLLVEIKALGPRFFVNANSYDILIEALGTYKGEGIVINSLDGMTIVANQAYLAMMGYAAGEIKSITYQQLTPAKWHAMEQELFQKVLKTGYSGFYEKEYIRKDGSVFPIRIHTWLMMDEEQKPYRLFGLIQDISAGKK